MNTPSELLLLTPYATTSISRLESIYADISRQKNSNPASFNANVEWWRTTLEAVVSSGIQKTGSRLVLNADASLLALLRVPGAGGRAIKPLALPTVVAELRTQKALFTRSEFLNSKDSVYNPGWLPSRIAAYVVGKPLWWALEQLGVVGEDSFVSSASGSSKDSSWWGEYVLLSLVESAADALLAQQSETVGSPADSLYSFEGFKKEFVPTLLDSDVKILVKFLQRDRGAVVVDGDATREITGVDRGILQLKEAVQHLHAQVADIQQKIDQCTQKATVALQQKHKPVALTYLRSRKQFEDLLRKRLGSLETLEATQRTVETAAGDIEILKSYETSTATLRSILAHPSLERENIDKTMDALAEANADAQEVDQAIRIGGDIALGIDSNPAFDEAELEEELRLLAKDEEEDTIRKKLESVGLSTPELPPKAEQRTERVAAPAV
ncbi:Snf7-domain-containing protein [Mycena amicta]|nr:Snf7-domain-containing protein [Mycena amicta]